MSHLMYQKLEMYVMVRYTTIVVSILKESGLYGVIQAVHLLPVPTSRKPRDVPESWNIFRSEVNNQSITNRLHYVRC